jgi:hypothetical protein
LPSRQLSRHDFGVGPKPHRLAHGNFETLGSEQLLAEDSNAEIGLWHQAKQSASWLLANRVEAAVALLTEYFGAALDSDQLCHKSQTKYKNEVLNQALQRLGRKALPLLEPCFATDQAELQMADTDIPGISAKLRQLFGFERITPLRSPKSRTCCSFALRFRLSC